MIIDNEKYFGKEEPEVKTVTVVDDKIDWEAKELNKVAKYFDVSTEQHVQPELLPDPPAEIEVDFTELNVVESKKNVSKAMTTVAMASAMMASDSIPPYLRRRRIPRVPSARELQSEESKQAALKAAEEKRQRKAAKRMKEFK